MNLTALQTAVKTFGFADSDPLTDWINTALHTFEDAFDWPFLEAETTINTVVGTNTLVLPADFYQLQSLKINLQAGRPDYMEPVEFEDHVTDRTVRGMPSVFTLIGMDKVLLWPTPDAIYSCRFLYRKFIPDLVNGVDVPAIPLRHHYSLVHGAVSIGLQPEGESKRATDAQTQFDSDVQRAISRYRQKQTHTAQQVVDSQGYFDNSRR